MKTRILFLLLSILPGAAMAQSSAWVQSNAQGAFEARLATVAAQCPLLHTDKGDTAMTPRAAADANFPLLCAASLPKDARIASIAGTPLPLPIAAPQRILVLGDTGCRIKGDILQACNDPAKWPFGQVAAAAARLKPDLIVHLGDYLYRESACPQGDAGCAGSPWGDNWITWQADFFTPAAPLLAAAPIILVRGNHEDCTRAGMGWQRLLSSSASPAPCDAHQKLTMLDLGAMRLAIMDDATASDTEVTKPDVDVYAAEIKSLADIPGPVWFVHHRPVWAAISGPLGIPVGGNKTLIAAAGDTLIPPSVELQLSGHIHTFEAINYTKGVPPQIVAGNGGDNLDITPRNLKGAFFQGGSGVSVADGLSVGGFGFLLMTRQAEGWRVDRYDSAGNPEGSCRFVPGRLDCPQ
jgi:predicted phosphodiesterase